MRTSIPTILLAAVSGLALAGCAAPERPASPAVLHTRAGLESTVPPACPTIDPELVRQGRRVYAGSGNCASCHGASGTGGSLAPNLTDSQWLNGNGSYGSIAEVVRSGVARPKKFSVPMPARGGGGLSEQQVCAVAAYVYSISH